MRITDFTLFASKGDLFFKTVHAYRTPEPGTLSNILTLCGKEMLSKDKMNNATALNVAEVTCPQCYNWIKPLLNL